MSLDLLPPNMIDPEGQPTGYTVQVGPLGNMVVAAPTGSGSLAWFNVKDPAYGAVGDGVADDTAAINAAIAALNAAGRGVLYFPSGIYLATAGLTAITVPATILGDGCADPYFRGAATTINCNSASANLFTLSGGAHGSLFSQISLVNTASSTPTAGTAILVQAGDGNRYVDVTIWAFYIDMDVQDGTEWYTDRCYFYGPVLYGLKIRHIDLPDGGDMGILNCQFVAQGHNATAAIHVETGGGPRIIGNKINMRTSANHFTYGIELSITAATGVLIIAANSIENCITNAIRGRLSGGSFSMVAITGNEVAFWTSGATAGIDINGFNNVNVVGNVGISSPASSGPFVQLTNVTGGAVGLNKGAGFAADFTQTSCTGLVVAGDVTSTRSILTGTGLLGGGDLSADRTLSIDTAAETERIQDTVGAMVVPSGGITAFYDDTAGTLTIGGGNAGELLMQDGVTAPPVPIENEARTDWLYSG